MREDTYSCSICDYVAFSRDGKWHPVNSKLTRCNSNRKKAADQMKEPFPVQNLPQSWPFCQQQWAAPSLPASPLADWWWHCGLWSCVPDPTPVPWFSAADVRTQPPERERSAPPELAWSGPASALHKAEGSTEKRMLNIKVTTILTVLAFCMAASLLVGLDYSYTFAFPVGRLGE